MCHCTFYFLMPLLSILIFGFGLPDLLESQQEYRSQLAFFQAAQIASGQLPEDSTDPWGTRFEIERSDHEIVVVTSFGPNKRSPMKGFDNDDVSSVMKVPPHERIARQKQFQLMLTIFLSSIPWLFLVVCLLSPKKRVPPSTKARNSCLEK